MKLYLKIQTLTLVVSIALHWWLASTGRIDSIGLWYTLLSSVVYSVAAALLIYWATRIFTAAK